MLVIPLGYSEVSQEVKPDFRRVNECGGVMNFYRPLDYVTILSDMRGCVCRCAGMYWGHSVTVGLWRGVGPGWGC